MADVQDLEPLLTTQQNDLMMVNTQGDGIDNKSLAILAVDVTVLIFVVDYAIHAWLLLVAGVPFALSIVFACLALRPKKYMGTSVDLDEHPEYLAFDRESLVLQLLADTQKAIENNQRVNRAHWRFTLLSALMALSGGIGIFAIL